MGLRARPERTRSAFVQAPPRARTGAEHVADHAQGRYGIPVAIDDPIIVDPAGQEIERIVQLNDRRLPTALDLRREAFRGVQRIVRRQDDIAEMPEGIGPSWLPMEKAEILVAPKDRGAGIASPTASRTSIRPVAGPRLRPAREFAWLGGEARHRPVSGGSMKDDMPASVQSQIGPTSNTRTRNIIQNQ